MSAPTQIPGEQSRPKKHLVVFLLMALFGTNLEVLSRIGELNGYEPLGLRNLSLAGWTSLWMLPVYGAAGLALGHLNEVPKLRQKPMLVQCLLGLTIAWGIEIASGYALNVGLGLNLWSYKTGTFGFSNQISVVTGLQFFLISPLVFWADDMVRWLAYHEERPGTLGSYYRALLVLGDPRASQSPPVPAAVQGSAPERPESVVADVGTIGERQFALWCEQADLTANAASQDRYGWDFIVQFPHLSSNAALDTRPAQHKCMVQVKSTSIGSRRAAIKLDNWERMINSQLPWFVCAMVVDGAMVTGAYLVHVDGRSTARVLERLRSLRSSHPETEVRLHEHTLDVSWGPENEVVPASGPGIRDAMLRVMGTDPHEYSQRKLEWYRSAGYDGHPKSITATISGSGPEEFWTMVTDFSLGLSMELPIHLHTIVDRRFGIPITEVDLTNAGEDRQLGFIKARGPSSIEPVNVVISDVGQTSLTMFRCDVYDATALLPDVPQKYRRLRFACPVFELLMDEPPREKPVSLPFALGAQFQLPLLSDPDLSATLADLAKMGRVLAYVVGAPNRGLRIELRHSAGSWTLPGDVTRVSLPDQAGAIAELLGRTAAIASAFDLDMDTQTSLSAIAEQQERFDLLWTALLRPEGFFPLWIPVTSTGQIPEGTKAAIVVGISVTLGDHRIVGAFAICGVARRTDPPESESAGLEISAGEVRVLWKEVVSATGWSSRGLADRLRGAAASLKGEEFPLTSAPSANALAFLTGQTDEPP